MELFVTAAQRCLSVGRRSLSVPQSLHLAAQVSAVDVGLKPALLYDSNGAGWEQVQRYLSSLQSSQLVSSSLLTLGLSSNTLIVNPVCVQANLQRVLGDNGVLVVDVCHWLEKPVITEPLRQLRSIALDLLLLLRGTEAEEYGRAAGGADKSEEWNLCTVFGLLLGYPITYWFDQTQSFENCLCMTPLTVTTASAMWQVDTSGQRYDLYSFSTPAALQEETQSAVDNWKLCLQETFQQQHVFKDLSVCQSTVTLPAVCL